MLEQEHDHARSSTTRPRQRFRLARTTSTRPSRTRSEPYFTTWVTQQAVDKFGADRVFGGGMEIKTTLDPELQAAAEAAVAQISGVGPVRLARDDRERDRRGQGAGRRRRTSATSPSTSPRTGTASPAPPSSRSSCSTALEQGNYGPGSVFASQPKEFPFTNKDGVKDVFRVAQLRGPVPRLGEPHDGDRAVGQLGLRRARHEGRAARTSPRWRPRWGSGPSSPPTRRCCSAA